MNQTITQQVQELNQAFAAAGVILSTKLDGALIKAALMVERDAKLYLTEDQHVDTGRLRASITHRLIDRPKGGRAAQVGTNVRYASDVEHGSGPRTVPLEDILAWAKRKGLTEEEGHSIWKSIEKYGTAPHPFLLPALQSNAVAIKALITKELQQGIREAGR